MVGVKGAIGGVIAACVASLGGCRLLIGSTPFQLVEPVPAGRLAVTDVADFFEIDNSGIVQSWGYTNCADPLDRPEVVGNYTNKPGPIDGMGVDPDGGTFQASQISSNSTTNGTICGLHSGNVYCWGGPPSGGVNFVGSSTGPKGGQPVVGPRDAPLTNVVEIAAGANVSCARTGEAPSQLYCWGDNGLGELTSDFNDAGVTNEAFLIGSLRGPRHVAVGGSHACAVDADGNAFCWGANDCHQTGQSASESCGSSACVTTPSLVAGISDIRQLALSQTFSCALDGSGRVFCWGCNESYQLGTPGPLADMCNAGGPMPEPCTSTPMQVASLGRASSIAVGAHTTCAVVDGGVFCWGENGSGELADPNLPATATAHAIGMADGGLLTDIEEVAAGLGAVCAMSTGGDVWCWGGLQPGQPPFPRPVKPPW
jgi:alpha-tubulin suppressor-like RCC1 family protein